MRLIDFFVKKKEEDTSLPLDPNYDYKIRFLNGSEITLPAEYAELDDWQGEINGKLYYLNQDKILYMIPTRKI